MHSGIGSDVLLPFGLLHAADAAGPYEEPSIIHASYKHASDSGSTACAGQGAGVRIFCISGHKASYTLNHDGHSPGEESQTRQPQKKTTVSKQLGRLIPSFKPAFVQGPVWLRDAARKIEDEQGVTPSG